MKKLFIFVIVLVIVLNTLSACQYTEIQSYNENEDWFYHNDDFFAKNINLGEFVKVFFEGYTLKAVNNLEVPIDLEIEYHRDSKWFGVLEDKIVVLSVAAKDFETYEDGFSQTFGCGSLAPCSLSIIKNKTIDPNVITSEIVSVQKNRTICKICPNGKQCLDDGVNCSEVSNSSIECGSRACNTKNTCGQIFNVGCPKGQELNKELNLCSDTSKTKASEWASHNIWWIALVIILGLILIFGYNRRLWEKIRGIKIKEAEEKSKIIVSDAEKKARKIIEEAEDRLEKIKKELENKKDEKIKLERVLSSLTGEADTAHEIRDQIKEINDEIKSLTVQQEEEFKKNWDSIKPFPDSQASNRLVIINPYLGGYKCFYDKDKALQNYPLSSLVHRWVWKEHHRRWPKKEYHIHHIDKNKYNNHINNLDEVWGEEHYENHRNKYKTV